MTQPMTFEPSLGRTLLGDSPAPPADAVSPARAARAEVAPRLDPAEPLPTAAPGLEGVDQLLRRPSAFMAAVEAQAVPATLVRTLLLTTVVGAGIFGAAMGAFRPGPQVLSAAVKLPLVLLFTAGVTVPAYSAARWVAGAQVSLRKDVLLFLSTLGLTSLVLAALAPVVLLAVLAGVHYHDTILTVVGCAGLAGLVGLVTFARAARRRSGPGRVSAALCAATVFCLVGTQMAWTLRPFVARPRADFEVLRPLEGSFMESVETSARSAQGIYTRDSAPLPEDGR